LEPVLSGIPLGNSRNFLNHPAFFIPRLSMSSRSNVVKALIRISISLCPRLPVHPLLSCIPSKLFSGFSILPAYIRPLPWVYFMDRILARFSNNLHGFALLISEKHSSMICIRLHTRSGIVWRLSFSSSCP
jgi:hypothetical protein